VTALRERMAFARTTALLTSVFSAGISIGYGGIPAHTARSMAARVGLSAASYAAPNGPTTSDPPAGIDDPAAPDTSFGQESAQLRALRSPEFEFFGNKSDPARQQSSQLAGVCGTGTERRVCKADDGAAGGTADTKWLVGLRAPDLPVHASVRVERFLRYLTESTGGRKLFRSWLKRSGRYHDVVAHALHERGIPQDVEAVVFIESGYSPTAVSSEGATGMWQFMAGTARAYGLAVDSDYDERRGVEKSTEAATRYLSDLYERFGSWELAFAAYDMGYGRLTQRIQELSTNDYWTLSLVRGALPDEALDYVPKILAVSLLLRNLDKFGFDDVVTNPPLSAASMPVPGGTPMSLVARAAGTSVDNLRTYNPEILTANVPDRGSPISVHLPARGAARANAMLPRLLSRFQIEPDERVDDGFDWGSDELAPALRRQPSHASLWDDPLVKPQNGASAFDDPPRDEDSGSEDRRVTVFYRVDKGESLTAIANRFGTRSSRIVSDNHLDPDAKLQKGMLLQLHVPRSSLSKLASVRPLDDSQYAPPVHLDGATDQDEDGPAPTVPSLDPAAAPPRTKHPHSGRTLSRRSMADFADLLARTNR
jgi:membrane-bound lytic murein transglycosylase D